MSTDNREQLMQELRAELRAEQAEYMRNYRRTHPAYVKRMNDRQRAKRQKIRAERRKHDGNR